MENLHFMESCINQDCSLILDAVRRLKEGTWHLCDEDSDWVDYLLPKIQDALKDHIEYENLCVLPGLPQDLAKEHEDQHNRILALLWSLDCSRRSKDFNLFHALLDLLFNTLEDHHHKFCCYSSGQSKCTDQCVRDKIIHRAKGSSLECL